VSSYYIRGGQVIDPKHGLDEPGDLLVVDGRVAAFGKPKSLEKRAKELSAELIDAKGLIICPGFVDLNARLGEPGADPSECIASGSAAAAAGGFTSVACMPSFGTVNDNAFITDYFLRNARETALVRLYPVGAITKGSNGESLAEIGSMHSAGIVALADDGRPIMDSYLMRKALEYAKAFGLPIFSFPQDLNLVGRGMIDEGVQSCKLGLRGIPAAAEEIMVARDIVLARHTDGRLHLSSISVKGALNAIRDAKASGIQITAETNPQYFTLTSNDVTTYDARFKCFPPLRGKEHVDAVVDALADGTLDAIASAHTPLSPSSKDMVFEHAEAGMPGFETALPLALALVAKGKLTLERMVHLLTYGPAKALGLKGLGVIHVGGPADIVGFDPDADIKTSLKTSPYFGRKLKGRISFTMVGGRMVFSAQGKEVK
jgi:dihydroorotase